MGFFNKLSNLINKSSNNSIVADNIIEKNQKAKSTAYVTEINYNDTETIEKMKEEFIAFDLETTGLSPIIDKIIEVGAVRFKNGYVVDKFSTLINPEILIPVEATKVNNITNEMVRNAPTYREALDKMLEFFGDVLLKQSNIVIVAHNANFDMGFLVEFLEKNHTENTYIHFADTLKLSKNLLNNLNNYKLNTVAEYLKINNKESHRAVSDAETCGNILLKLLPLKQEENVKIKEKKELRKLNEIESVIVAYIQNIIMNEFEDIEFLCFDKDSSRYITINYLYGFLKFKVSKNGVYFIVTKEFAEKTDLKTDNCSINEGGSENLRTYISNIYDIDKIKEYILMKYKECTKDAKSYINYSRHAKEQAYEVMYNLNTYTSDDVAKYIEKIDNEKLEIPVANIKNNNISREQILINPINTRINVNSIKKCDGWSKEFDKGLNLYIEGDELRKKEQYEEAIALFDKARETGYCTCPLYDSYSMVYRKLKDCDNEIDILEEGIIRLKKERANVSSLETRLNKAILLKYNLLEKEKIKAERDKAKEEKKKLQLEKKQIEKERKKENNINEGRHMIQMDDDGNIINEFVSVAEAVRQTGINSKSIRDAAKGVQKHAGGYCWKYKE